MDTIQNSLEKVRLGTAVEGLSLIEYSSPDKSVTENIFGESPKEFHKIDLDRSLLKDQPSLFPDLTKISG